MTAITWTEIEAECGDYRAGFVATFRKYEGRDTDERDGRGATVQVTVSSFARHAGIPETTFKRWVKRATSPDYAKPSDADAQLRKARSEARSLPAEKRAALAAELLDDDDVADQPAVRQATDRASTRRLDRDRGDMRDRGATPDDPPEPFPNDLVIEARALAARVEAVAYEIPKLLARAERDQIPALVQILNDAADRVRQATDVGSTRAPDFVPEGL